jgi:hypothetical protein
MVDSFARTTRERLALIDESLRRFQATPERMHNVHGMLELLYN